MKMFSDREVEGGRVEEEENKEMRGDQQRRKVSEW
jgi:hypothetical protein